MKRIGLITLAFLLPSIAFATGFSRNLQAGSSGPDVLALQKILNQDAATQVAASGPGSPGNETEYFGPATVRAVVKFQEKYRSQILSPNNLPSGNGFVGVATRAVLSDLAVLHSATETAVTSGSASSTAVVPSPPFDPASSDADLGSLAVYWQMQKQVAEQLHYSPAQIAQMRQEIAKLAATTTDLKAEFLRTAQPKELSVNTSFLGRVASFLGSLLSPARAEASIGAPFGGSLLAAVPCNGGVWNLVITPHSPFYPVLLSYESGSELFLWHNIPIPLGIGLKGVYLPVPMAYCWIGIYPFPSEGIITPQVGSSLLPAF